MIGRHRTSRLAVALAFTVLPVAAWPGAAQAQSSIPPSIILRVVGLPDLPSGVADRAQLVVTRIYSAAGAHVIWSPTQTAAPDLEDRFAITVLVRHRSIEEVPAPVLGFAPAPHGRMVFVLYDHVQTFALTHHLQIGQALGHVIAHEVGHLLLPGQPHSKSGLMRENLNFQVLQHLQNREILFTPRQALEIQTRLIAPEGLVARRSGR